MGLDPRSQERLRELGRSLPKPLPKPEAPPPAAKASEQRHKLETETNPEALFRELMQASPDGSVPPHLMARLKELEDSRSPRRRSGEPGSRDAASAGIELGQGNPALPPPPPPASQRKAGRTTSPRPSRARSSEEESLYTAFQQLLLEDDEA
ncbi:MAG: hypothetical protein ACKO8I_10180 [Cyanobacteriota bacterium]